MKTHSILKNAGLALLWLVFLCLVSVGPAQPENAIETISTNNTAALKVPVVTGPEIWKDPAQPLAARVQDLMSRLSLEEKASQLMANPPAIPRLGIPAYSHRNECLHGVGGAGIATVFPPSHRHGGHLGHAVDSRRGRRHCYRGPRQAQ